MRGPDSVKILPKYVDEDQVSQCNDFQAHEENLIKKRDNFSTPVTQAQDAHIQDKIYSANTVELNSKHQIQNLIKPINTESEQTINTSRGSQKIDLSWEHLNIQATIKKKKIENGKRKAVTETKTILNNISGSVKHGKFTAIMGPSGSGKTTLLNFLSARISGKGLTIHGTVKINGHSIDSLEPITNVVGYIMQDDILQATISPREALMFVANLRLHIPYDEKKKKVEEMLSDLGLKHVANTKIGNNLMRGLSGGERKRTSIGVELITDPSLIFLDEPTTGLDSKTAENVINLLVTLAKKSGKTVMSTIHQPSSQIYSLFDELILLVRGNIIYQGRASHTVNYFAGIGFACPMLTNPADYFMKIVNESGMIMEELENIQSREASTKLLQMGSKEIEARFQERLTLFNTSYNSSQMAKEALETIKGYKLDTTDRKKISWIKQFWYIFVRKVKDVIRNPKELKVKIILSIIFGLIIVVSANKPGEGEAGIQNRYGLFFFYSIFGFMPALQGSVGTCNRLMSLRFISLTLVEILVSGERPIFIRERLSKSYDTSAYFWAKVVAELPVIASQPIILVLISYFGVGLDKVAYKFFILMAIGVCNALAGAGFGLLISTFIPTMELAMAIVPMIYTMAQLFSGVFVQSDKVPYFLREFQYMAPTKYAFQASAVNEFTDLDICGGCDPLVKLGSHQGIGLSIGILLIISVGLRVIAYHPLPN